MPLAIPDLIWLALLLFSFGVVYALRKFVQGLFSPLISAAGWLPGLGGWISGQLRNIEQSISGALGSVEAGIDSAIGASFHALAELTNYLWRELKGGVTLIATLSAHVANLLLAYSHVLSVVHDLTKGAHSVGGRIKTLEREFHGIEHGVRTFEKDVGRVLHKDVLPELRSLDRELTHTVTEVIPAIRSAANTAEHDVTALQKWIVRNVPLLGTTALVGAIAWALGQLGLGGLRCSNFTNLLKRWGCGLGALLDGLLGLVISALALENVCTFLPLLETAFGDVAGPIIHLLTEVPLGGCETPPKSWATLSVAYGPLPPAQTLGTLPS